MFSDDGVEGSPSGVKETVTLTAWQPGSENETRVGFGSDGDAYWQKGDAIGVLPSGGSVFSPFTLVDGAGTGKASFRGTVTVTASSNKLCGAFTAGLADATPEIKTSASDADNTVTFEFSGATADQPGVFYLPVATGSYTLTVDVYGGANKGTSTTTHSVEVVRERLQVVNVTTDYIAGIVEIDGHKFVDLGLPSGLLWAETNIGAKTAADYGNYYAWGEVTAYNETTDWASKTTGAVFTKTAFNWVTYKYGAETEKTNRYRRLARTN